MLNPLMRFLYPPKCVLCQKLLSKQENALCHTCSADQPVFVGAKKNISFVAGWTALWYYKDKVRDSILRYKFARRLSYADSYGLLLALHLVREQPFSYDLITWVPVSEKRRYNRGYDQTQALAKATAKALGQKPVRTLKKIRDNPAQSSLAHAAQRKANVMGVYRVIDPNRFRGKTILLLDDVITTGATLSECARVLMTAGAKAVYCAAIAAKSYTKR